MFIEMAGNQPLQSHMGTVLNPGMMDNTTSSGQIITQQGNQSTTFILPNTLMHSMTTTVAPPTVSSMSNPVVQQQPIQITQIASAAASSSVQANANTSSSLNQSQILDKKVLQELVKEVDPTEQLDEDVEDLLLQVADDFIENVINSSCQLAKHRKSSMLEVKDVQFNLERNFNLFIPGFSNDDLIKQYKKSYTTEAHKQVYFFLFKIDL